MRINELYDQIIWNDKNSIVVLWHTDDVKSLRPDLDDDQCMEVLRKVERHHDPCLGISWDTIEHWIGELFPVEEKVNKDEGDWFKETVNDFMSYLDEEE